jgi:hypothetical protein
MMPMRRPALLSDLWQVWNNTQRPPVLPLSTRQISENNASTISKHFTPGITLRSIWFMT